MLELGLCESVNNGENGVQPDGVADSGKSVDEEVAELLLSVCVSKLLDRLNYMQECGTSFSASRD